MNYLILILLLAPLAFSGAGKPVPRWQAGAETPTQSGTAPGAVNGNVAGNDANARKARTKQRDVAYLYTGNNGYELTYKGPHSVEKKELEDYLRRRKFSLETLLRVWTKDAGVALFYDGNALAGNLPAQQITLINAKDESVSLFFDIETHLPIKKTFTWRDPVDKEKNVEEEIFDNYRLVQGVMTAYGFTRYFNGDMQTQRFVNSARYNQPLDESMFDPNARYDPNKAPSKH